MKTYLLDYKKPNIFTFHGVFEGDSPNTRKDLKLLPGINEISEELWHGKKGDEAFKGLKNHPQMKQMIEDERAEWESNRGPEDDVAEDNGFVLEGMKEKEAIKVVKQTLSRDLLLKWLQQEQREKVFEALNEQLKKLAPLPPEEKGKK